MEKVNTTMDRAQRGDLKKKKKGGNLSRYHVYFQSYRHQYV